jgi:putative membrane protein
MARTKLWKGLLAGSAAGLAGTVAMNQFQSLWSKAAEKMRERNSGQGESDGSGEESEDATMKAAGKLAELARHKLSHDEKKKAGPIIHYAFGTGMGTLYGLMLEYGPRDVRRHPVLSGLGFGSVLFAGADEIAVPALGLSGKPSQSPPSSHLYGLASHIVYGITAGTVRKAVRAAL